MQTPEIGAPLYNAEVIREEMHPFLASIRPFFTEQQYQRLLEITRDRLGTLNPDTNIPYNNMAFDTVFDHRVHSVIEQTVRSVRAINNLEEDDPELMSLVGASMFSVWAYGTNPTIKNRYRHEGVPYAMHPARSAQRFADFDVTTLQSIYLHDVPEDTPYTIDDIRELFGETLASIIMKVTKIDIDLEDLENLQTNVEVGVAQRFIALHQTNGQAQAGIERAVKQTHSRLQRASSEHLVRVDYTSEEQIRQRIEMMHLDEFSRSYGIDISPELMQYIKSKDDAEMLTLLRIFSSIRDEDDVRALIVKIADHEDNSDSLLDLARVKGRHKIEEKAQVMELFSHLARTLGLPEKADTIDWNVYKARNPEEALRFQAAVREARPIKQEYLDMLEREGQALLGRFHEWAQRFFCMDETTGPIGRMVIVDQPSFHQIRTNKLLSKGRVKPLVDFEFSSEYAMYAFIDFLAMIETTPSAHMHIGNIMTLPHAENDRSMTVTLKNKHTIKIPGYLWERTGAVADMFRVTATDNQRYTGRAMLKWMQRDYETGKFDEFLGRVRTGSQVVSIDSQKGRHTNIIIPGGASKYDVLLQAGYQRDGTIFKDGRAVEGMQPRNGDMIVIGERSIVDPFTFNHLQTPEAKARLSALLEPSARAERPNHEQRYLQELMLRRGRQILRFMVEAHFTFDRGSQVFSDYMFPECFFDGLFERQLKLLIEDQVLTRHDIVQAGMYPEPFPTTIDHFQRKDYAKVLATQPGIGATALSVYNWMHQNVGEIPLRGQARKTDVELYRLAHHLMKPARLVSTVPAWTVEHDRVTPLETLVEPGQDFQVPADRKVVREVPLIRGVISTPFDTKSDLESCFYLALNRAAITPFQNYARRHRIGSLPLGASTTEIVKALVHPHLRWISW
jgi:hypothetical protein